jgi:uncharacterized protein
MTYGDGRPPIPRTPVPLLMFTLNPRLGEPLDSEEKIYQRTRCCWKLGPERRDGAVFALGVVHGVVRGAYRIRAWEERDDGRWSFVGEPAPYLEVVGTSIERFKPKRGDVSPVHFFKSGLAGE